MNILEVKGLCKTYIVNKRQNNVLKNINFMIGEGEMVDSSDGGWAKDSDPDAAEQHP